ncbi:hypothetical protein P8C59_003506 [Phyllachora maydis]|uniref:Reverse transcriptase Ty1/copia-type domain-containing protein n=1 Tax=Phyllachora maydis TaxID=1825666 RepID=A0AAD9I1J9_9PEZI|nr:hypothetical protein P8C59_003506 [Phyllachora maydis]
MYLLRRSYPDLGQSSRPLLPIRTLLEDKEDGEDYSEVIEVLKQHIKSHERVIASQSSNIKTLLLSLNTLKASIKDSVSAIKNISSTLASLTNSSNTATAGKTSYSPRFDPFSSTIDLDSPLYPPRKEPYLEPAVNSATSNLDPPIDIGSKEGFKDTITSSIVKELSKKAYTIPDNKESRNLAIEAYRAAYVANSSNSTPNSNSNPSKKGKNKKKGKKKASYNIKGQNYSAKSAKQASFMLGSYNLAIEEEEEFNSSSNSNHISNSKERFTTFTPNTGQLRPINTGNSPVSPAGIGSITLEVLSRKAPPTYTKLVLDNVLYLPNININIIVVEIPSNSIRKEDYRPVIEDTIVSEAIEPNKRYKLRNSPAKGTTLEGVGPSLRGKRPCRPTREPEPLTGTRDLPRVLRELVIEGNKVEKAISSPTLKEPNIGQRDYYNLLNLAKLCIIKGLPNFDKIKEADFHCSSYDQEGELVDLDLDLEGAVSLDPSNLNTEKPISIEIGPSKLEPYESSSNSELDEPSPDKPINPVVVESTRPTISIRKPELPEPITNEPLNNSDLISEGDKMQLDYYKLLAKTSSYILDERSKWLEAITKEFIQLLELGVFKFLPRSLLSSNCKLIICRNVLKVKKDAKNRPIKYKSRLVARGFIQVEGLDYTITYASTRAFLNSTLREEIYIEIPKGLLDLVASNKAIYKLLLKNSYNPSTPNIIKLFKALYSLKQSPREWQDKLKILLKSLGYLPLILDLGVFYNAKTCHFIVTYKDDCLFIGPNIGYITDLKKQLNKVYAIEDLGPAAYFLGMQIIRDRPNRRL